MVLQDDALVCPRCGGTKLHHQAVEVFNRTEEDGPCMALVIPAGRGSFRIGDARRNPSPRGQGVLITMRCETCRPGDPEPPRLAIYQHRGQTFIEWWGRKGEGRAIARPVAQREGVE